jgi:hypothetical protein
MSALTMIIISDPKVGNGLCSRGPTERFAILGPLDWTPCHRIHLKEIFLRFPNLPEAYTSVIVIDYHQHRHYHHYLHER